MTLNISLCYMEQKEWWQYLMKNANAVLLFSLKLGALALNSVVK